MKKFLPALIFSFFFIFLSFSQEFKVKGKVLDVQTKTPLEATTIYAESVRDSSLITYTISDKLGNFILEGETNLKEINLFFSYNGYKTLSMIITLKEEINLGKVLMEEQAEALKGVQVTGERVPIRVKQDTLEFNADSFKTRPDATVEDVLKKLPGVEVDSDGKITVNGKEVSQVLVNGQVFFSKDPKVATKSLPKEIISKIQILDTKTKEQEFTGESGDGQTKTINLTIKDDKNKGYLGRIAGGYGTDERYQGNGLLNYFNDKERISIIAGSNNINNAGFSFDEIYDMIGNSGGGISINNQGGFSVGGLSFGFGQGIITSSNVGASYAIQKNGEYEASGNYFLTYSDSFNDERTARENILPDRRFFTNSESSFKGIANTNQGAAELEFDIDSTLRISAEPSLSINRTNSSNRRSTVSSDENGEITNSNESVTLEDGMQRNFTNEIEIFKKLDTLGRSVRFSFRNRNSKNNSISNLNAQRLVFGDDISEDLINQLAMVDNNEEEYALQMTYRQPLVKKLYLDFGYEYSNSIQNNSRQVFDFDSVSGDFTAFNQAQSSDFSFRNIQQFPSLGIRMDKEELGFNITAKYANTDFSNLDLQQNTSFSKQYKNILLNMFFRYKLGKNSTASINYRTNLEIPSVVQLQPVPNLSDPLNVVIGNPNLKPTLARRVYLNFNDYNWKERTGLFMYAGFLFDGDKVASVTETDENLLRTTRYANVDGNYNHYGGIGYSKQLKKDSTLTVKFNVNPYFNFQKNVGFTNGERLEAKRLSLYPRISTSFNYKELLEIEPEYTLSFGSAKYNVSELADVNYISHTAKLKTTTYWPQNIIWGNDVSYNYNGNVGSAFDKDALFWNMSLGVQFFKKNVTLKVLAYDLLNQNINTRRSSGQDFIQDFQGTVLQRYFMCSVTFKFDQFGGEKSKGGGIRFFGS